jgi:hypothetical protein
MLSFQLSQSLLKSFLPYFAVTGLADALGRRGGPSSQLLAELPSSHESSIDQETEFITDFNSLFWLFKDHRQVFYGSCSEFLVVELAEFQGQPKRATKSVCYWE